MAAAKPARPAPMIMTPVLLSLGWGWGWGWTEICEDALVGLRRWCRETEKEEGRERVARVMVMMRMSLRLWGGGYG